MQFTADEGYLIDTEASRDLNAVERTGRSALEPSQGEVSPKPIGVQGFADTGGGVLDERSELVESGDRDHHDRATKSLDRWSDHGFGRVSLDGSEYVERHCLVDLAEIAQRDVPLVRCGPADPGIGFSGQLPERANNRWRRPRGDEKTRHGRKLSLR